MSTANEEEHHHHDHDPQDEADRRLVHPAPPGAGLPLITEGPSTPSPAEQRLDVVVLGASGVTGRYVAAELSSVAKQLGLTVGVAGRNTRRLRQLLGDRISADVSVLHADIKSTVSLNRLCSQAKVLINTTGPFYELGEPVIKACLRAGTHYLDICGERLFIEKCQVELNDTAERRGVYCVSTCGFDSIPAEVGSLMLQDSFEGGLSGLRCYLRMQHGPEGHNGVHYGTWVSSIHGTACVLPVVRLQSKLFPTPLPKPKYSFQHRGVLHRAQPLGGRWCLPFLGPDVFVHARTQAVRFRRQGTPPAQMQQYVAVAGFWRGIIVMLAAIMFGILCFIPGGQWLLRRFPEFFSAGIISRQGPTPEQVKASRFEVVCEGEGWKELSEPEASGPPDTRLTLRLQFPEAAYATTALCIVQCAVSVLKESLRMPGRGGVLPPGAAFAETSLIERLQQRGMRVSWDPPQKIGQ